MSARDYVEKDYYKALGVPSDADTAAIKKAYRGLARKYHPDANKGDKAAEERFKEISEAYDVLSDDKRRKEYDDMRAAFPNGRIPGVGGDTGFSFNIDDLLKGARAPGGLGDVFGTVFNRRGRTSTAQRPIRGADLESEVTLAFAEALDGATVQLRLTTSETCRLCLGTGAKRGTSPRVCPKCEGSGSISRNQGPFAFAEPCVDCKGTGFIIDDPCPDCGGTGRERREKPLTVRIPPGVNDGQRIRLAGKGVPGTNNGPAGDLIVTVHVGRHQLFGRSGDNLTLDLPVTFTEAALGADVKVPVLAGNPVTLRLPAGTANGRTFRVRGKGATRRDGSKGDLLVTVALTVPPALSPDAAKALQAYADLSGEDPRARLGQVTS